MPWPQRVYPLAPPKPTSRSLRRPPRRRALTWVIGVVVLAAATLTAIAFLLARGLGAAPASLPGAASAPEADLFMQSVVEDDGALGWKQLCPATQAQVPRDALIRLASADQGARVQGGLTLTWDYLGARARPTGGELRVYLVTGHWRDGTTQVVTYSVWTQASGCVEDVKHT